MSYPLVSVIIPTYQRAHTIKRAVRSALEQDYPSVEVVVSDNASSDNTEAVLEGLADDKRLRVVRQDRNIGPVPNWRATLDAANGDLVKVNWSDDWMEPHVVSVLVRAILSGERVGFALANQRVHLKSGSFETVRRRGLVRIEDVAGSVLLGLGLPVSPGAGLIRRDDAEWALTEGAGDLDLQCAGKAIGPDLLMLYGALRRGHVGIHTGTAGVHFGGGDDSITVTEDRSVLSSCYVNALMSLVEQAGDRRVRAMVHQLLVLRRIRYLGRATVASDPSTEVRLSEALSPAAFPLATRQLVRRLCQGRRAVRGFG